LPNEFQQMAGRAGRRGLDAQGQVVVPYSPWIGFNETIEIGTGPLLPVESAFSVRYNSVLNLWDPPQGERVMQVLRHSLLEFQQSRRLRELASDVHNSQQAYDGAQVGCLIGYPDGEELLHEYESIATKKVDLGDQERRAVEDASRLWAKIEERPWRRPLRETLRQVFRTLEPGTILHTENQGWGVYLSKASESGIGLFLFGDKTVQLDEYRWIDYLPPERFQVNLPLPLTQAKQAGLSINDLLSPAELAELQQQLIPIELPDLAAWQREAREKAQEKHGSNLDKANERAAQARLELKEVKEREKVHPCQACDVRKKHRRLQKEAAKLLLERDESQERYDERKAFEESRLQSTLNGIVSVLRRFGFLNQDGQLNPKSGKLRDVFDNNGLIIIEMIGRGWLNELLPHDVAEVFSWFAYDRDFEFVNRFVIPRHLTDLRRQLDELEREVFASERQNDLMINTGYNVYFYGATRAWGRGASLASIIDKVQLAEGDIIITFNKTLDLMRQVTDMLIEHEPESPLISTLREAKRLLKRGVVEQVYNIGFGVLQDVLEGEEEEASTDAAVPNPGSSSDLAQEHLTGLVRAAPALIYEEEEAKPVSEETSDSKRRFGKRRGKPGRYVNPRRPG